MASNVPCKNLNGKSNEQQILLRKFLEEAFHQLLEFYELHPKSVESVPVLDCEHSTPIVNAAVLVFSYMFRPKLRNCFKLIMPPTVNAIFFQNVVTAFRVPHEGHYFLNFLVWIAYVFDFTVLCFIDGMDYFELALQCLSEYPDIEYFHSRGGWEKLREECNLFYELYELLQTVIYAEKPQQKTIYPFFDYVHKSINNDIEEDEWFWSSQSGTFIIDVCRDSMKEYNLDTSSLSDKIKKISPKSIPQTPLPSPQQAFSETSAQEGFENTSSQSDTRMCGPLTLNPITGKAERFPEVGQLSENSVKTPPKNLSEALKILSKHAENTLTAVEGNLNIGGATANLTIDETASTNISDIFSQCSEFNEALTEETKEMCRCLIEIRLEHEKNAGVSWKKLAAEQRDPSEPKRGVYAEVASSSETADSCQSVEATKQSKSQKQSSRRVRHWRKK